MPPTCCGHTEIPSPFGTPQSVIACRKAAWQTYCENCAADPEVAWQVYLTEWEQCGQTFALKLIQDGAAALRKFKRKPCPCKKTRKK